MGSTRNKVSGRRSERIRTGVTDVPVRSTEGLLKADDTAAAHPKTQAPRSRCSVYTRDLGANPW